MPETRQRDGQSYLGVVADSAEENTGGRRHFSLMVFHAKTWSGASAI